MMALADYLVRYYVQGENPFLSLNDLEPLKADRIRKKHCLRNSIGGFYAEDDYLRQRKKIENWIYQQLIKKGGTPTNTVPVYMTLGESPEGEYNIRNDIQKNSISLKIPIKKLDLSAVTFTFPDSMYKFITDRDGNIIGGERTNTPDVYLYHELDDVIKKYRTNEHYIEAQVWNREMLYNYFSTLT